MLINFKIKPFFQLRYFIQLSLLIQIIGLSLSLWANSSPRASSLNTNRKVSTQIQSPQNQNVSVITCRDLFRSDQTQRAMTSQTPISFASRFKTQFLSSALKNITTPRQQFKNENALRSEIVNFSDFNSEAAEKTDLSLQWINRSDVEKFIKEGQFYTQNLKNDELLFEIKKLFEQDLLPESNHDLSQRELSQFHLKSFFLKRFNELQNSPRLISESEARKNFRQPHFIRSLNSSMRICT